MLEVVFLSIISSMIGVVVRAVLEMKRAEFFLYHCILVGFTIGIVTFFFHESIFNFPMTTVKYLGVFIMFFMTGYVLSDLIETFAFLVRRRKHRHAR